ncbi:hypothetical protein DPMN_029494 [Dreissena polymorpha]|uniref:Uncharacterized protein n=1 Tax=Dreissena polymorpha TaxID=45954 RepID=A0A9D4RFB8_DREPO|nr:hypothetical protein DPMN_029494 [Dreissena polymorpha]
MIVKQLTVIPLLAKMTQHAWRFIKSRSTNAIASQALHSTTVTYTFATTILVFMVGRVIQHQTVLFSDVTAQRGLSGTIAIDIFATTIHVRTVAHVCTPLFHLSINVTAPLV